MLDVSQISPPVRILLVGAVVLPGRVVHASCAQGGRHGRPAAATPAANVDTATAADRRRQGRREGQGRRRHDRERHQGATPASRDARPRPAPPAKARRPPRRRPAAATRAHPGRTCCAKLPQDVADALKARKVLVLGVIADGAKPLAPAGRRRPLRPPRAAQGQPLPRRRVRQDRAGRRSSRATRRSSATSASTRRRASSSSTASSRAACSPATSTTSRSTRRSPTPAATRIRPADHGPLPAQAQHGLRPVRHAASTAGRCRRSAAASRAQCRLATAARAIATRYRACRRRHRRAGALARPQAPVVGRAGRRRAHARQQAAALKHQNGQREWTAATRRATTRTRRRGARRALRQGSALTSCVGRRRS